MGKKGKRYADSDENIKKQTDKNKKSEKNNKKDKNNKSQNIILDDQEVKQVKKEDKNTKAKKYKNDFLNEYDEILDELENKEKSSEEKPSKKTESKKIKEDNVETKNSKVKKKLKKRKKKKHYFKKILIVILSAILVFIALFVYKTYKNGGGVSGILQTALGHTEETRKNLPTFNCLLLGVSTDLGATLTDTIMVVSYNPNSQKGTLFSIQRDTFIGSSKATASGGDKINAIYSYKGPEGTLDAVNDLLGLNIKYYAVVKTEALKELVDEIGGVTFNVPENMKYDDPSQNLHINLKRGEQLIDGEKAEQLLRFRHNNDGTSYSIEYGDQDIGRMRTQREFITETIRQTCKASNFLKIGKIIDLAKRNVDTNINLDDLKDYIPYVVEFDTQNLQSAALPGKSEYFSGLWFFTPNKKETAKMVTELFVTRDMTPEELEQFEKENPTLSLTSKQLEPKDITIQIQNGTGSNELFEDAVSRLQEKGYVVKTTNKELSTSTTTISNRNFVDDENLNDIKEILGTGVISNNSSNNNTIDVYITLGTDYRRN